MKTDCLKFVQWSEPDQLYVGNCPDLFIGGICHGSDEQKVYRDSPASSPPKTPKASAPNARCLGKRRWSRFRWPSEQE